MFIHLLLSSNKLVNNLKQLQEAFKDRFGAKIIHREKMPIEPCKIFLHAKKKGSITASWVQFNLREYNSNHGILISLTKIFFAYILKRIFYKL